MDPKTQTVTREEALQLFGKQASADGIDLSSPEITEEMFNAGFESFIAEILPEMIANGGNPVIEEGGQDHTKAMKAAAAQPQAPAPVANKVASNAHALFEYLFLKQAAAEGVDLSQHPREKVAAAFEDFVANGIPQLLQGELVAEEQAKLDKQASASLNEMQIMGEHFGDVASARILQKLADAGVISKEAAAACAPEAAAPGAGKAPPPFTVKKEKTASDDRVEAVAAQRAFASLPEKEASAFDQLANERAQQLVRLWTQG